MKNCSWSSEDPRVFVSSRLPKSPATDYVSPEVNRVAASIKCEDDFFAPKSSCDDGKAEIFANIDSGGVELGHGSSAVIDCGFEMELPPGYRISVSSSIDSLFLSLADSKRIKVSVFNAGDQYVLQDRQAIGKIWIEPVYFF